MSDDASVLACPECNRGEPTLLLRAGARDDPRRRDDPSKRAWCSVCQQSVDPIKREPLNKGGGINGNTLAAKLDDADPDDLVTDGGLIQACPCCDSTHIYRRRHGKPGTPKTGDPDHDWICKTCQQSFDAPIERERQHEGAIDSDTLAGQLEDAEPGDLVTDGGIHRGRYRPDAVRQHAGVADQDTTCPNGTEGCPGPGADTGGLPCSDCFLAGGATDD